MTDRGVEIVLGLLCLLGPLLQIMREYGTASDPGEAMVDWLTRQSAQTLAMWQVMGVFGWVLLLIGVAPK
ncbi:MAG TPA: hypothetical protein VL614_15080 [Acetobacteraceae bacterium]|jgi:hypothetical protein|nr:hypothetical protein [Acetobacteraceae bacterium]